MGRAPCCEKIGLKRGRWTVEEDEILTKYIQANGEGHWRSLPKNAGLLRCGKSCRLRWVNYLKADLKRGNISTGEENIIISLHATVGNRWSLIASYLPGRTDNEIKNYWNSHLSRKIDTFRRPTNSVPIPIIMDLNQKKNNPPTKKKAIKTSRRAMKKNKTHTLTKSKDASSQDNITGEGISISNKDKSIWFDSYENGKENKNLHTTPTLCEDHGSFGIMLGDGISSENNNKLGFDSGNMSGGRFDGVNDDIDILSFPNILDDGLLDDDWPPTSSKCIDKDNAVVSENKIEEVLRKDIASPKGGESGEWNSCSSISSKCLDDVGLNWDWEDVAQGNGNFEVDDYNGYPFRCLWESEDARCDGQNFGEATYGEKEHALVSWLLS